MAWKRIRVGTVSLDLEPPNPNHITFVGSRRKDIPDSVYAVLEAAYPRIARALVPKGIIAVSGGADGMDRLAEAAFGRNIISYRTELRDNSPSFVRALDPKTYRVAEKMVAAIHPAWNLVKPEHRPLHARNMAQVLSETLRHPTSMLIAWAKTKGVSVDGGTHSAYELSNIVHDGAKTYNLATKAGQRGVAAELRALGVPVERGSWYPRPTQSLGDHARDLLNHEGHSRIGIAIPIGPPGTITNAERLNISARYAPTLALAKAEREPSVIGDAWDKRVVLVGIPQIARDEREREQLFAALTDIAHSNALSRLVVPHEDLEPGRDLYTAAQASIGAEALMDSPLLFATLPDTHRGLSRTAEHTRTPPNRGVGPDIQPSL